MRGKRIKLMSLFFCGVVILLSLVGRCHSLNVLANVDEEKSRSTVNQYYKGPLYIDFQDIVGESPEGVNRIIQKEAQNVLLRESNRSHLSVRQVNDLDVKPSLGTYDVEVVVSNELVPVPVVESVPVIIYGAILKQKMDVRHPLSEIQKKPELLLETIQTTHEEPVDTTEFHWVNNKEEPVELEQYLKIKESDESLFIKMTDKDHPDINSSIPVPDITVMQTMQQRTTAPEQIIVSIKEQFILRSKLEQATTEEEIKTLVKETHQAEFSHRTQPGNSYVIESLDIGELNHDTQSGTVIPVIYSIRSSEGEEIKKTINTAVLLDEMFGGMTDWEEVDIQGNTQLIENPINQSKLFLSSKYTTGFSIKDSRNNGYINYEHQTSFIPYKDEKVLYQDARYGVTWQTNGFGNWNNVKMNNEMIISLKNKQTGDLKQIIVETNESLVFVLDLSLKKNLNFQVMLTTYNSKDTPQNLSMLEFGNISYLEMKKPVINYGDGTFSRGFTMRPNPNRKEKITISLKNKHGDWYSDYRHFTAGSQDKITDANRYPYAMTRLNYAYAPIFGNDFKTQGLERFSTIPSNALIMDKYFSSYQLGSDYHQLSRDESFSVGYQVFVGEEVELMTLSNEPEEQHVYADDPLEESIKVKYLLEDIPENESFGGRIFASVPSKESVVGTFDSPVGSTSVTGELELPSDLFPEELNRKEATVKKYPVYLNAENEQAGTFEGLSSEDALFVLHAYKFGAKPIHQTLSIGSKWEKKPEELLSDKTFLPGNEISFKYVGKETVDTSKKGLQNVVVNMTDNTANKSADYTIQVNVVEGEIPKIGLTLLGNDFLIKNRAIIETMSDKDLDHYVLKEANAMAWNNETGLSEGITLSIESRTLKQNSPVGNYQAVLLATNGNVSERKTITIEVLPVLTAELNLDALPKNLVLGSKVTPDAKELKKWVKEVTYEGQESLDFEVSLMHADTTQVNDGTKENARLEVTVERSVVELPISLHVSWGNSLVIGGGKTNLNAPHKESMVAYTIHEDEEGPYITTTYGNLPQEKQTIPFDARLGEKEYASLTRYPFKDIVPSKEKGMEIGSDHPKEPSHQQEVTMTIKGNQTATDIVEQNEDRLSVAYGDVLELYVSSKTEKVVYYDGVGPKHSISGLPNDEKVFGVVTPDGFEPLYLSHLETSPVPIETIHTVNEEAYDEHYDNYFSEDNFSLLGQDKKYYLDLPSGVDSHLYENVEDDGFKEYPVMNLSVGQKDKGIVYVSEELPNQKNMVKEDRKYVKYAYEVEFVGDGPTLTLLDIPEKLTFGQQRLTSYTQRLPQKKNKDERWGFSVNDSRSVKQPWVIQARMEQEFSTGIIGESPLKGAYLEVVLGSDVTEITADFSTIFRKNQPSPGINPVYWENEDGFYMVVPPGDIKKGKTYQSVVDLILVDAPS